MTWVRFVRLLSLTTALFLAGPVQAKTDYRIYFTAQAKDGVPLAQPAREFDCSETVYAVVQVEGLSRSKHLLEMEWWDPRGKRRDRTEYPFFVQKDKETLWTWMRMHRPSQASFLQAFDPAAGMEEFIGTWSVSFFLNKRPFAKKEFQVIC